MASAPELDLAALTAPISGDNPAGGRVPITLRQRLESARKDLEANPDDPTAAPIPKVPDWPGIIKLGIETISQTSKDLETGLRITEALTRQYGMVGLRKGFELLKALVENCWDFLHPIPDTEDGEGPEIRAERFNWIGDMDAGARFPHTLRAVPFMRAGGKLVSLTDREAAFAGKHEVSADDMNRAQLASPTTMQEVEEAYQAFFDLDRALTEKLENRAPGMMGLRQVLDEVRSTAQKLGGVATPGAAEATNGETSATVGTNGAAAAAGGVAIAVDAGTVRSRDDVYRMILQLADALERMEPHSPIPDLLRRAVDLGRMPFRRLIKELITDSGNLAQVYREFGIRDEEAAASG
jgi:type VI secretion system protein ImpA